MSSLQNSNTSTLGTGSNGRTPLGHSHSTHAPLETFDQATREAAASAAGTRADQEDDRQVEQQSSSSSSAAAAAASPSHSWGAKRTNLGSSGQRTRGLGDVVGNFDINDAYILQANSAVQLDRDVRQSRQLVDDSKQKGVHGQTPSAEAIPSGGNDNVYIE
ncbi:hypothetical protein DFQ26_001608 [Actinomortierella ambigua]|nr:hypothetical protein DFQ26_001608 [Actinomortierella ambigua]